MATKTTYVTLKVMDDDASRPWWDSLNLPAPERWSLIPERFAPSALIEVALVVERAERG